MKRTRSLSLSRETIRTLSPSALRDAAGGYNPPKGTWETCQFCSSSNNTILTHYATCGCLGTDYCQPPPSEYSL